MKDVTSIRSLIAEMQALEIPAATLELYTLADSLTVHESAQAIVILNELETELNATHIKLKEAAVIVDGLLADNANLIKSDNRSMVRVYEITRNLYNALMARITAVKSKLKYNHFQLVV